MCRKVQAFSRCLMFCSWLTEFETPASTNISRTLLISVTRFQILRSTVLVIEPLKFTYIHYIRYEVFKQLIFYYINFGYDCMGRSSQTNQCFCYVSVSTCKNISDHTRIQLAIICNERGRRLLECFC